MNFIKRSIAVLLIIALVTPMGAALADTIPEKQGIQSVDNGYLKISVNPKNGGFHIATVLGDKLNKDDNNKDLLYPSGDYDTSFTTLRVIRDGETKDYIFGGKYSDSQLQVEKYPTGTGISAEWSVDGFEVEQRLELVAEKTSNHGMVQVTYDVVNTGEPAEVELRILMDTALDKQDYAYYEVLRVGETGFDLVTKETAIKSKNYGNAFFAYNDLSAPTITAYSLKVGSDLYKDHEEVIFGHWNNLASTAFEYKADSNMNFTNTQNTKYLTADSAYALYYDLGTMAKDSKVGAGTIYGVYSHADIDPQEAKVTVDVSGPERLTLDGERKEYTDGSFNIAALLNNFDSDTLKHIALAVRTPDGINPVINGKIEEDYSYSDPYTIKYENFLVGQTRTAVINFNAEVRPESQYRKIILDVYNISGNEAAGGKLLSQNLIGTAEHYIYCPGGVVDLPEVSILSGSPNMLYYEGTRYYYLSGTGFSTLETQLDKGDYSIFLQRTDGLGSYSIDKDKLNINATENTANLLLDLKLPVGQYQLLFEASGTSGLEDITSPALGFLVTDDAGQKNTTYGLVAVTKTGSSPKYNIEVFESETKYKEKYGSKPHEILLIFRGGFTTQEDAERNIIQVEGASTSKNDNVMTLNNSIDIQEGSVVIRKDGDTVKVDFNAKLYTTGARSLIWSGSSCLTGLEDGKDFALIPYNKNGERLIDEKNIGNYTIGEETKPITIIWGSMGGRGLQALAGMLLNMEFGNLGVQIDGSNKEIRRVVSFGAELDLGFLFPDPSQLEGGDSSDSSGINDYLSLLVDLATKIPDIADAPADTLRELFESTVNTIAYGGKPEDDDGGVTLAIRVPDVIFGGAFLGFICSAEVKLPSYVDGFPELEGKLVIKTVGDWSMAAEGKVSFTSMVLEAKLGIKSYNGIPIPDNFYLFVGGFSPGINVDGFGVLWIMGGGGGLEEIYDTIFCSGEVPPLTLLLSVQASILQVFEARADLSLSLRGIGLELSDGRILKVKVIDSMKLKLDWYPEFYFLASVSLGILDVINGSGYIVVEHDGFFEFAAKASVQIPDDIPAFGGINVATINLGANATRIYGTAEVLLLNLGVVYYWGGDFEFGEKDEIGAGPTYPELLEFQERPVYVDPDTGETLYMLVGTNLSPAAVQLIEGKGEIELMDSSHKIESDVALREHKLTLDKYDGDHLLVISYDANDWTDAEKKKNKINFGELEPIYYPEDEANAHFNYVKDTKRATVAISFTEEGQYENEYTIKTPLPANLMLMKAAELPEISKASYSESDKEVTVEGKHLDELESISFFAVNKDNEDDIYLLGKLKGNEVKEKTKDDKESLTYKIGEFPDILPTGDYRIQVTGILEGYVADSVTTIETFKHENSNQPENPKIGIIESIGNGMVKVNLTDKVDCDGYIVNVYRGNKPTDVQGLTFKDADKIVLYGGKYDVPVFETEIGEDGTETLVIDEDGNPIKIGTEKKGLSYNVDYTLGISAYKIIDEKMYISGEVNSNKFKFTKPTTTTIKVTGTPAPTILEIDYMDGKYNMPYYKEKDIELKLKAGGIDKVKGTWNLDKREDEGYHGDITESANSFTIILEDLPEGEHLLEFDGKNNTKDNVSFSYVFTVDTMAPRLLIESPDNGGFFDNDKVLEIKGITDEDATITVMRDKDSEPLYNGKPQLDSEGRFIIELNDLPKNHGSHKLTITAEDAIGNKTTAERTIVNRDLGKVTNWRLYAGEEDITDTNLMKKGKEISKAQLSLRGRVEGNPLHRSASGGYELIINDPDIVSFNLLVHKGEANIDSDNNLTVEAGSIGLVSGVLRISDTYSIQASAYFDEDKIKEEEPEPKPKPDGDSKERRDSDSKKTKLSPPATEMALEMLKTLPLPDYPVRTLGTVEAAAGERVYYTLPAGINPNLIVVIHTLDTGEEILLPLSMVVNGDLSFRAPYKGTYRIGEINVSFKDIEGHWGNGDILYVAARGLFNGTSKDIFSPDTKMSRAMVVTLLGRLANADTEGLSSIFDDVPEETWYTAYVTWAKERGIVTGINDNSFEPDREITRQELCTILYRYLSLISAEVNTKELSFSDKDKVAAWAKDAMEVCVGSGLIVGYNNEVRPGHHTMRSEAATIFARLIRLLATIDME